MNIYTMTSKEFAAVNKEFNHTAFGKRVAILSNLPIFALFFWALIFASVLVKQCLCTYCGYTWNASSLINCMIVIGFFLLGTAAITGMLYYKELRRYLKDKEQRQTKD